MKILMAVLVLAAATAGSAQVPGGCTTDPITGAQVCSTIVYTSVDPTGTACTGLPNLQVRSTGAQYSCQGGYYAALGIASVNGVPITPSSVNSVGNPATFAGATADVQITNCLSAYLECDWPPVATPVVIPATVIVPTGHTLKGNGTSFQAGGATVILFQFEPESHIDGVTFDCGNQPFSGPTAWTGNFLQNDPTVSYVSDYPIVAGAGTTLEHVGSNPNCNNVSTGNFLLLNAPAGTGIYSVSVNHARINGLLNALSFTVSNGGWINGLLWHDIRIKQSIHGAHITPGASSVVYGGMTGNTFMNFSCEGTNVAGGTATNTGVDCILFDGVATNEPAYNNAFYGAGWDYPTPIHISNTNALNNYFNGYFIGNAGSSVSDVTGGQYTFVTGYVMQAPSVKAQNATVSTGLTVGGVATTDSTIFDYGALEVANSQFIASNIYGTWPDYYYSANGPGFVMVTGGPGTTSFFVAPYNYGGHGAAATLVPAATLDDTTGAWTFTSESSYAGYAMCYTTAGLQGHCTSVVGAGGGCTCVSP